MKDKVSPLALGFMIIGALCGAAFASGQEILKFFCSYGKNGIVAFVICFLLYSLFGRMTYFICRRRNTDVIEEIIAPSDSALVKKLCKLIVSFCFFVIMTSLFAAGDAVFVERFGLPKGVGGLIIVIMVIGTNLVGIRGIAKIVPKVVPLIIGIILIATISVPVTTERVPFDNPEVYSSPLAPMWILGAILYFAYNFLAAIPVISTLPQKKEEVSASKMAMLIGFGGICMMGIMICLAISTDVGNAGKYELPMVFLSGKVSPLLAAAYSVILIAAIYCSSSNCLFGLTKDLNGGKKVRRNVTIIVLGLVGYALSLEGFSTLVTYVFPVVGYACIITLVLTVITFAVERFSADNQDDIEI